MDGKRFDTIFEDFIYKLLLTKTQKERIDNAITAAEREFGDKDEVALQGSFATGTTVKPLSESMSQDGIAGEYDVVIATKSIEKRENLAKELTLPMSQLVCIFTLITSPFKRKTA